MAIKLIPLHRVKADHPLVRYARAETVAAGAAAIAAAKKQNLLADADFRLTAAGEAASKRLADLPANDCFVLQVRALDALAHADPLLDAVFTGKSIPTFAELPEVWREAHAKLVTAQECRVKTGRLILLRQEPFFNHFVRALHVSPDTGISTACVDLHFRIRYHPGFFAGLNLAQLTFVLLHEAEHVAYRHISRSAPLRPSFKAKDEEAWSTLLNIAADLEILWRQINGGEKRQGAIALAADIPGTLASDEVKDGTYGMREDWRLSRDYKIPQGPQIPLEKGFMESYAFLLFDQVVETTAEEREAYDKHQAQLARLLGAFTPGDGTAPGELADHDREIASVRAEGESTERDAQKHRGTDPGGPMTDLSVPQRPTPFSTFVERLAGTSHAMRGTRPAWIRPAYYAYVTGIFEPARTRVKEPVMFAFDTSGSIGLAEISFAFNCLHGYAVHNLFSTVHLLLWHTTVYHRETLTAAPDLGKLKIASGGTELSCVASYLDAHPEIPRPKLTVFVTDGCIESTPRLPPGRVLILCTVQSQIAFLEKQLPHATVLWVDITE